MSIVDFDLPIYRASRKSVSGGVEGSRIDHILVAMLKEREALFMLLNRIAVHCVQGFYVTSADQVRFLRIEGMVLEALNLVLGPSTI